MNLLNYEEKVKYIKEECKKSIKYDQINNLENNKRDAEHILADLKSLRSNNYDKRDEITKAIDDMEKLIKEINKVLDVSKNNNEKSFTGLLGCLKEIYRIGETPVDDLKRHLGL
ncbi:MAG: hypothetical protein IKP76_02385 [Bacilli bacterium]|nr:hypothetical protein [Bacilli bacterium]